MSGKSDKSVRILERQARVREYLFKRYSKESISKIMGVPVRTIARDAVRVWADVRKEVITKPMEQNIDEVEKGLMQQMDEARIQYEVAVSRSDPRAALGWQRLLKDLQDSLVALQQKAGRAPVVAEKVEQQIAVVDNPLLGLYDDSEDKQGKPD